MVRKLNPDVQIGVVMITFFGYLTLPFIFGLIMYCLLQAGAFSAESDAIAIPIIEFSVVWYLGGIVATGLSGAALLFRRLRYRQRLA